LAEIKNIIFDLGGVLVDWSPKYVYRTIFSTEKEVDWFLENICTMDWNEQQDAGRSLEEATRILIQKFPDHAEEISAYYGRWTEMLGDAIPGTVDILKEVLETKKYRVLALTNWSAETFPVAQDRFEFLKWFEGIVISGVEKCKKPEPEIYNILLNRYDLKAEESIFIDDNPKNINQANQMGIHGILFISPENLKVELDKILRENS